MTTLAAHQPDLFPWPGFWLKMARADVFDLAIYDQFRSRGYQRRVMMAGSWASLPVLKCDVDTPICDVRIAEGGTDRLIDTIQGRYAGAPFFRERWDDVARLIDRSRSSSLWQFNVALIVGVRDMLDIDTPVSIGTRPMLQGIDGILEVCDMYPFAETYLSGGGGRAYMGEVPELRFIEEGLDLEWIENPPVPTRESILTVLFHEEDPTSFLKETP